MSVQEILRIRKDVIDIFNSTNMELRNVEEMIHEHTQAIHGFSRKISVYTGQVESAMSETVRVIHQKMLDEFISNKERAEKEIERLNTRAGELTKKSLELKAEIKRLEP